MSKIFAYTETLVIEHCANCGMPFAMPGDYKTRRHEDGNTFYCPSGHSQHYTETLKQKYDKLEQELVIERNQHEFVKGELNSTKGKLSRTSKQLSNTKKRIANGICPCCKRQFVNLHRHMAGQHPEYVESEVQ